jgi:putative Mg2+ transporter-C (MgtC) family protein
MEPILQNLHAGPVLMQTVVRLVLAGILGGAIGMEREFKRKPAGLRTNMFICIGAALFTLLSDELAGHWGGDHTRIAAQIIPGIGFIGAGSILQSRGSVTGLTTAATLFVVASIGMAVGGGLYAPAVFATIIVGLALLLLGWFEESFGLKPRAMVYEVFGQQTEEMLAALNSILDSHHHKMQTVQVGRANGDYRVIFSVDATKGEHDEIFKEIRTSAAVKRVEQLTSNATE